MDASHAGDNCVYDNQIFYANQSIITFNCAERCQCHHINGTKITKCKPLCPIEEDPKYHPYSEKIKEFKESQNDTNCTCTHKKCVSEEKITAGNGASKSYIVALSVVFGILFIVIVLAIVFIVCLKKLQSNEENVSLKNAEKKSYKTLD